MDEMNAMLQSGYNSPGRYVETNGPPRSVLNRQRVPNRESNGSSSSCLVKSRRVLVSAGAIWRADAKFPGTAK
jgi:hypothetical protein